MYGDFMKLSPENPNSFKTAQKYWELYENQPRNCEYVKSVKKHVGLCGKRSNKKKIG
jgi:hypothetical protein